MKGVRARGLLIAVVAIGVAALSGCGGTLSRGVTGTAGTTGAAGTPDGGGTTGEGGAAGSVEGGACPPAVSKGVPCGSGEVQFCYKPCGPEKIGMRSETCDVSGVYYEMPGCSFDPNWEYSCYRISTVANTMCAAGVTPQASAACDLPPCVVCNSLQGLTGGQYLDSSGAVKVGYCVCTVPNAAGVRTWSCASDTAWPCPLGYGCGAGTAGTGGSAGAGGTSGGGGITGGTGTAGTVGGGQPSCIGMLTVSSNMEPAKGIPCDPAIDINLCYRTCGPEKRGYKAEFSTTALSYQEMSGCAFDPGDYSCYKIADSANTACPAGVTPQGSAACDVPMCTVCNSTGGLDGGQYLDSTGAAKTGFCVCQAPNASGVRTWSCAQNNGNWPCPLQYGC